nr:MAG TPA: hypothetical protein [Bacteriophage sp.]
MPAWYSISVRNYRAVFHKQNIPYQEAPLLNCGGAFVMQRGNIWNFI